MLNRPLCIYHGGCQDGFTAAWVVNEALDGDCDFHPGIYQDPPPDVKGRTVYIVDFSYKRPVMEQIARDASSVVVLDHHKSAVEDLSRIDMDQFGHVLNMTLDMGRSGAGITWDYFFDPAKRPALINMVEDRDLFKFAIPNSNAFSARLFAENYRFETWRQIANWPINGADMLQFIAEGRVILDYNTKNVEEMVAENRRTMVIAGYAVPVCNLPKTYTTEAGHIMAIGERFAACYWDTPAGRVFSLRSTEDGMDVAAIAARYGGGGHRHAAGFRVPYDSLERMDLL